MSKEAVIVFLRNFQKGKVKTRLAQTMGEVDAMKVYRQLCGYTLHEVLRSGLPGYFYFSDHVDKSYLRENRAAPDGKNIHVAVQSGANLGERMHRAFQDVLSSYEQALIIGTDCPYLTRESLRKAMTILDSEVADVVVGPAADGGYYALGMKQPYDVFEGVEWSSDLVFDQTIKRCEDLGLTYKLLPKLRDVDYENDWIDFQKSESYSYFQEVIRASSSTNDTVEF